ncbi:MAG: LuxR C-terminal-related transcriptional regulator [Candidatus Kapabacteria bacterium]|nr:LuxR C-terminal-related transcriptional regulator [Candidatus Kapabacteria bacterium]
MLTTLVAIDRATQELRSLAMENPQKALEQIAPLLAQAEALNYVDGVGTLIVLRAHALVQAGRPSEADELATAALHNTSYSSDVRARALRFLALRKRDHAQYDEALRLLDLAIGPLDREADSRLLALIIMNRATILARMGLIDKSLEEQLFSLRLRERHGDVLESATNHQNIANLLRHMGRLEDAYRHATRARNIFLDAGLPAKANSMLGVIGRVLLSLGDAEGALQHAFQLRDHARQSELPALEAEACTLLSNCYVSLEMFVEAEEVEREAHGHYEQTGNGVHAFLSKVTLATIVNALHRPREALEILGGVEQQRALMNDPNQHAQFLEKRGDTHRRLHMLDHAITDLQEAYRFYEKAQLQLMMQQCMRMIAVCYLERDEPSQARDILLTLLPDVERVGWNRSLWQVYELLSQCEESLGRYKKALAYTRLRNTHKERAINEVSAQRAVATSLQFEEQQRVREQGQLQSRLDVAEQSASALQQELHTATLRMLDQEKGTQDWSIFQVQFDRVHVGFLERLARLHPQLSASELRVCSLTRMQMSTKNIASLLATSTRTVEGHRLRIRRKLNIDGTASLTTFLSSI